MARETVSTIGKMLYGFVFVVVLPLLPIAWASLTKKESHAPDVRALSIGLGIAVCCAAVILFGMIVNLCSRRWASDESASATAVCDTGRVSVGLPPRLRGLLRAVHRSCDCLGSQHMEPHDLRRTCAKLCHTSGGESEQIEFLLGHASVRTTERYLGCWQNLGHPVNDRFVLVPMATVPLDGPKGAAPFRVEDSIFDRPMCYVYRCGPMCRQKPCTGSSPVWPVRYSAADKN